MPRPRKSVPTYRRHKQSGQAIVTLRLPDGSRKDVLLGRYNSPESKTEYRRLIAELESSPSVATVGVVAVPGTRDVSVNELMVAFLRHAEQHYRRHDGTLTDEVREYKQAFKPVRALYGFAPAREFGPLALKAVRDQMVKAGWCRSLVNQRSGRVRRMFKWAAGEELVTFDVYQRLTTVQGLQRGRSKVRESEPVTPVDNIAVRATLPFVRPTIAAMVELQLLTGMRPGEVCRLRPCEIDTSGSVWVYRPSQHKTAWRGKPRAVAIGPKGQGVLRRFWPADPEGYVFSPQRSVEEFHAERGARRKTPKYPSHMTRNAAKRAAKAKRGPAERYTTASYGRAIGRGVVKANARREGLAGGGDFDPVPHWHPNQLRHTHGTLVRQRYGLEAAQVVLGHSRADVTQVYAERDMGLALRVASEIG